MEDCIASGKYLDRRVAPQLLNMPTMASRTKKELNTHQNSNLNTGTAIAMYPFRLAYEGMTRSGNETYPILTYGGDNVHCDAEDLGTSRDEGQYIGEEHPADSHSQHKSGKDESSR
jgi:hypothetical protein